MYSYMDHLLIIDEATKEQNLKAWKKKSFLEKMTRMGKFFYWDLPKAALKRVIYGTPSKNRR